MKNKATKRFSKSDIEHSKDIGILLEMAYVIFENYRPHKPLEVCGYCCVIKENVERIYKTPVRELPALVIYDYLTAVECGYETGLSDEIRYFIPRIFELLIQDEEIHMNLERSLQKCYLGLGVWSELELSIFRQFAKLFLKEKLCQYKDEFCYLDIFGIIEMFYFSGMREIVDELLEVVLKCLNNDIALINFCREISYGCDDFFNEQKELADKINHWINHPHHKYIISQKILALINQPIYRKLDDENRYFVESLFDRMTI